MFYEELGKAYTSVELETIYTIGTGIDSIPRFYAKYIGDGFYNFASDSFIIFRIPEFQKEASQALVEKKTYPVYIEKPYSINIKYTMQIPENFIPVIQSDTVSFVKGPFNFTNIMSYDKENSTLLFDVIDGIDAGLYPVETYDDFKKYTKTKLSSLRKWVILKRQH